MLTPEEIASRQFLIALRGYDREEVDAFVREVADEQQRLLERLEHLEERLSATADAVAAVDHTPDRAVDHREAFRRLGEETTRILVAAEEAAAGIEQRAEEAARATVEAARESAQREVDEARRDAEEIVTRARDEQERALEAVRELEGTRGRLAADLEEAVRVVGRIAARLRDAEPERTEFADEVDAEAHDPADAGTQTRAGATALTAQPGEGMVEPAEAMVEPAEGMVEPAEGMVEPPEAMVEPVESLGEPAERMVEPAEGMVEPVEGLGEPAERMVEPAEGMVEPAEGMVEPAEGLVEPVEGLGEPAERMIEPEAGWFEPEGGWGDPAGGWGDPAGGWGEPAESQTAEPGTAIHLPGDVAPADAARSVSDVVSYSLREEALAGIRPGMVRRLKRNLQDVQNGVLDTLRRAAGGGEVDTPSGDDLHALARVGEPFLVEAYRVGLRDGARLADVAPIEGDVDAAPARAAAEALGEELAHEIAASLEPTLRAGLDAGEDISSLSDRVGEVFRDLKGPVAEAAVHEHLTRTYGLGVHDGWGAGGVTARVWVLGDEPRCPENRCRSNASEGPVALDREFPSGHLVPPAHPGCTCTVAPAEA